MSRRSKEVAHRLEGLRRIDLFAGCTDAELERIDRVVTYLEITPGTTLTVEGAAGRQAMIVVDGTAVVTRAGSALAEVGPGSIIGEAALLGGGTRNATVTSESEMKLFVVNATEFRELMEVSPCVARAVSQLAEQRAARVAAADRDRANA